MVTPFGMVILDSDLFGDFWRISMAKKTELSSVWYTPFIRRVVALFQAASPPTASSLLAINP